MPWSDARQLRAIVPDPDDQAEHQHHQPGAGFGLGHAAQQQQAATAPEQPVQQVRAADHQQQAQGDGEGDEQGKGVRVFEQAGGAALVLILGGKHRQYTGQADAQGHQFGEQVQVQVATDQQGNHKQNQADAQLPQMPERHAQVIAVHQAQHVEDHEPDQVAPDVAAQAFRRQLMNRQLQHQDQRQRGADEFGP